jgi:beta-lactamase regulating signal transducer with metallopeptidase domain
MPALFDRFAAAVDAHVWVAIILDAAIKGAVILTLAGVVAVACRRASAAVRHLAWTLSVVGLCVLPALSANAPRWRVPILPPSVVSASAPPARDATRLEPFKAQVDPDLIVQGRVALMPASSMGSLNEATKGSAITNRLTLALLLIWASGAAVVMAQVLVSLVAVWQKGRRTALISDGAWASLVSEIAQRYGIRRAVSLRVTSGGAIPSTWGLGRPVVLLPVEAMDWSQDRVRAMLLHEFAHIKRGDFLVQTLARFACALHWFNPLVWFAERRLRVECEQASDDLVLSAGLTPADYATHLVEVLMAVRRGREAPQAALAMARRNGLEARVRAILDGGKFRRGLTSRRVAVMALAAICFVLPLGFVRMEARAHDVPKLERLPQGMTIEVVGVSTHPSGPATWWGPDGTPLAKAPCDAPGEAAQFSGKLVREVVALITGLPEGGALTWHPTQCTSQGLAAPQKDGTPVAGLQRTAAQFSEGLATCDVHFDIAIGPWKTERAFDGKTSMGISKDDRAFFFGKAREIREGTAIGIAHNITDRTVRLVAIDRDGKEREATSSASGGAGHLIGMDVEFSLPPGQIQEYQLQSRPVGRFEIKNVALQPRKLGP